MSKFLKRATSVILTLFVIIPVAFHTVFKVDAQEQLIEVGDSMSKETMALYDQCTPRKTQAEYLDNNGELDVVVWNVYKQNRPSVFADLTHMEKNNRLMLLQEVSFESHMQHYIKTHKLNANMVSAFKIFDVPAGVMTLSRSPAIESCDFLATEPWLRLPKSALLSHFSLSNGEKLIAINLHSINFTWRLTAFNAQLETLVKELKDHKGPIIVGGDFNTWRGARLSQVKALAKKLGLKEAQYHPDNRKRVMGHHLDHLYYRGLDLISAKSLHSESSDHNPIEASFKII